MMYGRSSSCATKARWVELGRVHSGQILTSSTSSTEYRTTKLMRRHKVPVDQCDVVHNVRCNVSNCAMQCICNCAMQCTRLCDAMYAIVYTTQCISIQSYTGLKRKFSPQHIPAVSSTVSSYWV